jgi:hypothetical protein
MGIVQSALFFRVDSSSCCALKLCGINPDQHSSSFPLSSSGTHASTGDGNCGLAMGAGGCNGATGRQIAPQLLHSTSDTTARKLTDFTCDDDTAQLVLVTCIRGRIKN